MKTILIIAAVSLFSATAMARNCQLNDKGEVDYKTICELDGSSYMLKQCKEVKVPGSTPGTYKVEYVPKKIGWGNILVVDRKCDLTIHECKELAQQMLDDKIVNDECGQSSNMKKVKFEFKVLNELSLEFKSIHKQTLKN